MVPGVRAGVLLAEGAPRGSFHPVATWPEDAPPGSALMAAARQVLGEQRAQAMRLEPKSGGAGARHVVAHPVTARGELLGVAALELEPSETAALESALRALGWGVAWLELRALRVGSGAGRAEGLLELVMPALEQERFQAAATAFATELATATGSSRVSLGFVDRSGVGIEAISHSSRFQERSNPLRAVEAAMEEALDQDETLVFPSTDPASRLVLRSHEELARIAKARALCTVPFAHGGRFCGAATFERQAERPYSEADVELIEAALGFAGPTLDLRRREDRSLVAKARESARTELAHLVGPRHVGLKLTAGVLGTLLLFMTLVKGDFRVTGDAVLEPRLQRAAVAPFRGYIADAPVRAGDLVREGDLLALLDDKELALERARWATEVEQLSKRSRQALAERDAAAVRIVSAQLAQARAQLDLARQQLSRTRLEAPFDGIVVRGNLSQQLGAPVERGDVLFEVAPLDDYRVVVQVDESDIDELAVGQSASVVLTPFPDEPLPLVVEQITPVSEAAEGRNTFRVEARLEASHERLRPGMEGVAKVEIGPRRLIWIWTHEAFDWLRLTLWNWMP